jgi:hypothetical protein
VGAQPPTQQTPFVNFAVSDQAFLCLGILLVKKMVTKGEEDRPTLDAFRSLHNMRMMSDNEVRAMFNQPSCLLLLNIRWPILQLVTPVDGYNNKIRQLSCQTDFLRKLHSRNLLNASIGGPDHGNRDDCHGNPIEAKELW